LLDRRESRRYIGATMMQIATGTLRRRRLSQAVLAFDRI
jgi:hypothetical protein